MGKYFCLFWDLGGKQILRSIWKKYYKECHGLVYVIDCTNNERIEEASNCLSIIYIAN